MSVSLSSLLPPGIILCSMVSLHLLINHDSYEFSDTVGGSNKKLTDVGTNEVVAMSVSLSSLLPLEIILCSTLVNLLLSASDFIFTYLMIMHVCCYRLHS